MGHLTEQMRLGSTLVGGRQASVNALVASPELRTTDTLSFGVCCCCLLSLLQACVQHVRPGVSQLLHHAARTMSCRGGEGGRRLNWTLHWAGL